MAAEGLGSDSSGLPSSYFILTSRCWCECKDTSMFLFERGGRRVYNNPGRAGHSSAPRLSFVRPVIGARDPEAFRKPDSRAGRNSSSGLATLLTPWGDGVLRAPFAGIRVSQPPCRHWNRARPLRGTQSAGGLSVLALPPTFGVPAFVASGARLLQGLDSQVATPLQWPLVPRLPPPLARGFSLLFNPG